MPDTGAPWFLPYPDLADEADAPKYIGNLAVANHAAMNTAQAEPAVHISRAKTTSQTMATASTYYTITYDVEEAGNVPGDITYAAGIFTFPSGGVYHLDVGIHFQISTVANLALSPMFNASRMALFTLNLTQNGSLGLSRVWHFNPGDTFSMQAQSSLANTIAYGAGTKYSFIDITRIGP
jgi:hypothetical protein